MHSERRIVRNGCLSLSPLSVCSSVSVSALCQRVRLSQSQPSVSVFVCLSLSPLSVCSSVSVSALCQCVRLSQSQPPVSVFVCLVSTLCQLFVSVGSSLCNPLPPHFALSQSCLSSPSLFLFPPLLASVCLSVCLSVFSSDISLCLYPPPPRPFCLRADIAYEIVR